MVPEGAGLRPWIAALWLAWQDKKPWIGVPIPHIRVNYEPFKTAIWLPVEVAVFCPGLDEAIIDASPWRA